MLLNVFIGIVKWLSSIYGIADTPNVRLVGTTSVANYCEII